MIHDGIADNYTLLMSIITILTMQVQIASVTYICIVMPLILLVHEAVPKLNSPQEHLILNILECVIILFVTSSAVIRRKTRYAGLKIIIMIYLMFPLRTG